MELVDDKTIRFDKHLTKNNLSDVFTNIITEVRRMFLLKKFTY